MKIMNKKNINIEALKNALCNNDINYLLEYENEYFIDERFIDENNDTLLMYSISDEGSDVYKFLIEKGANLGLYNNEGEGIVHAVIFSKKLDRVRLVATKSNINIQDNYGITPLLLSCMLGFEDVALELLKLGANPTISDDKGLNPLHVAAQEGLYKVVIKLLEFKMSPFIKTKNGNLPIALAANAGQDDIVKLLYSDMYG